MSVLKNRKFTVGSSVRTALALTIAAPLFLTAAQAVTKGDNVSNLDLAASWVGGIAPTSLEIANWWGAYEFTGSLSAGFTASTPVSWGGISVGQIGGAAGGLVSIGGTGAAVMGSSVTIGNNGIDLSLANQSLVINAATTVLSGATQTWNIAAGRSLRFGTSGTGSANANVDGTAGTLITVTGGGIVELNQGGAAGFADAAGFAGFNGKWIIESGATVRAIRNGATAFGSNTAADAITLKGGTLALGGPVGVQGNWTWNTPITLTPATNSTIDNQFAGAASASLARYLKLNGVISGSGNLTFAGTATGNQQFNANNGFILTGANTMSGTITIAGDPDGAGGALGGFLRVGGINGATGQDVTTSAGSGGSLGTANVVNHGVLTFSWNDARTVSNIISGTGAVNIGGSSGATIAGAGTQILTLAGNHTYTGGTRVQAGVLNLGGTLTSAISVGSGATLSGSGSTTGIITLDSGSRIVGGTAYVTGNGVVATGANAVIIVDPTASTLGAHNINVIGYGTGAAPTLGNFNGGDFRGALVDDTTYKKITLSYTTEAKTWNAGTGMWDNHLSANWTGGTDNLFFANDAVTFGNIADNATITIAAGGVNPSAVAVTNTANEYTFAGAAITGPTGLTKSGDGTLKLSVQNTYTGGTTVNGGVLDLTGGGGSGGVIRGNVTVNPGAILRLSVGDALGFNNDATAVNVINLNGSTLRLAAGANQTTTAKFFLTGATIDGTVNLDLFSNNVSITTLAAATSSIISTTTMNLRQDNTQFAIADGAAATDLLISSNIGNGSAGNHNLHKVGTGTLELAGVNTYSGSTTVNEGTLLAANSSGSATGTGAVIVADGATLGGIGSIVPGGANGISIAGVLSPGKNIGTLTIGLGTTTGTVSLVGGEFKFELGSGGADINNVGTGDLLAITGASANDFAFSSNLIDFSGTGSTGWFKLFDTSLDASTWTGLTIGSGNVITSGLSITNLALGYTGELVMGDGISGSAGDIYANVVPEPGSTISILGGLGILMSLRRRRRE